MPRVAELLRASRPGPDDRTAVCLIIARDVGDAAELSRDRTGLDPDLAVDPAILLAAVKRRAGKAGRHVFDPSEEGPYLFNRVCDEEALPEFDLRLPVGLKARGRAYRHAWRGANDGGNNGDGSHLRFAGAPRSGRSQSVTIAPGNSRNTASATIGNDALNRAHDADIAGASAEIAAHRDADVMLAGRLHAQHDVARGNDHARRAIAALQRVVSRESRP